MIVFIYAQDKHGGIGYQNQLPWHLPNDLKFFKDITMGHTMVMGRKTFEAMDQRLLPGRETIVISRNPQYGQDIEGLTVLTSIEPVIQLAKEQDVYVIGGSQIFDMFCPYAEKIYRTMIDGDFQTDTYMKNLNLKEWDMIEEIEGVVDDKNLYPHRYQTFVKRQV